MADLVPFLPARNKLEAVARISHLTNSGPETLGPGSKERKSVVVNLARGLGVPIADTSTKQEIARVISHFLGVHWNGECESVGQTLTLKGLNLLLEAATRRLQRPAIEQHNNLNSEAQRIRQVVVEHTPLLMRGKESIQEMHQAEYTRWRETEWQGFYFEFKVCPALINALGGGPVKVLNTTFDYALTSPWDLKVHSSVGLNSKNNPSTQLNDRGAIIKAVDDTGLGLVVLSGLPTYSEEFTIWHKSLRGKVGTSFGRTLKSEFRAQRLDFFFIESLSVLEKAVKDKMLVEFKQGRQPDGSPRRTKFSLNIDRACGSNIQIGAHTFT